MKFTTSSAILALTASTLAAPLEERATKPYTLETSQTNSFGLLEGTLHANGQNLWINKPTATYCPPNVGACPAGNITAFATSNGLTSMDVATPGGQQLFIGPKGLVRYTIAHSGAVPEGSTVQGVKKLLLNDKRTWLCNVEGGDDKAYRLWVAKNEKDVPAGSTGKNTCTRVTLTPKDVKSGAAAAWQYE